MQYHKAHGTMLKFLAFMWLYFLIRNHPCIPWINVGWRYNLLSKQRYFKSERNFYGKVKTKATDKLLMAKWAILIKAQLITKSTTLLICFLWIAHFHLIRYTPLFCFLPRWLGSNLVLYLHTFIFNLSKHLVLALVLWEHRIGFCYLIQFESLYF